MSFIDVAELGSLYNYSTNQLKIAGEQNEK